MEAPLKKTVVHLALVCLIISVKFFGTVQCSSSNLDKSSNSHHSTTTTTETTDDEKTVAKRSLPHSYQSGFASDFAYNLPATAAAAYPANVYPQYVKQFVQAAPLPAFAAPAFPIAKPLVFPAYQQKIVPGNAFVTSHSVTFPRYAVLQRPVVYAQPPPVAQFVPAPVPTIIQAPAFFNGPPQLPPQPPQVPVLPPPPPPVAAAPAPVRPFIIVTKPLPPPPPAPIFPAPSFVPSFAVAAAAPVPCHHQSNMPSNQMPINVPSPSEQENFGFVPNRPWQQHGGGGSSYLPPSSSAHLTHKRPSQPLRVTITSKFRPRWK